MRNNLHLIIALARNTVRYQAAVHDNYPIRPFDAKQTTSVNLYMLDVLLGRTLSINHKVSIFYGANIGLNYMWTATLTAVGMDPVLAAKLTTSMVTLEGPKPFIGGNSGIYFKKNRTWYLGLKYIQGTKVLCEIISEYSGKGTVTTRVSKYRGSYFEMYLKLYFDKGSKKESRSTIEGRHKTEKE